MRPGAIILCSLALAGCATTGASAPAAEPAHVGHHQHGNQGDQRAILLAFQSADAVLFAVDALVDAGVIKPGSPRALKLAQLLRTAKAALNAAALAERAGDQTSYWKALADAETAFAQARLAIMEIRR